MLLLCVVHWKWWNILLKMVRQQPYATVMAIHPWITVCTVMEVESLLAVRQNKVDIINYLDRVIESARAAPNSRPPPPRPRARRQLTPQSLGRIG